MSTVARNDYLETEVMTATPQKLHLMLVEAAIRKAQRCLQCWRENNIEEATDAIVRAQQIVTEVLCSLKIDKEDEVARKMAGVYLFVFRTLARAQLENNETLLEESIAVLEVERETWRQACEKFGTRQSTPHIKPVDITTEELAGGTDFQA